MLRITNVVVQACLNVSLNLKELVYRLRDVKYNPKRFSAIIWHHKRVGGSCLLFNNGQLICHGSKSLSEAKRKVRQFARLIQKQGYHVNLSPIKLLTASAVADLGHPLDLPNVAQVLGASFEPELFNGAVFYKGRLHFSCFSSGKIIITGISSLSYIDSIIYPTLLELEA
jgi:transcription initiation factor TFIID TATA-box-binding protein